MSTDHARGRVGRIRVLHTIGAAKTAKSRWAVSLCAENRAHRVHASSRASARGRGMGNAAVCGVRMRARRRGAAGTASSTAESIVLWSRWCSMGAAASLWLLDLVLLLAYSTTVSTAGIDAAKPSIVFFLTDVSYQQQLPWIVYT
eukprot:COSAG02_NODE_86_length_39084_cov_17.815724_18_plen_145_part_00